LNRGIFAESSISVIASATVGKIVKLSAHAADVLRFCPKVLISFLRSVPLEEDDWVDGIPRPGRNA